jgi:hypothetical protein
MRCKGPRQRFRTRDCPPGDEMWYRRVIPVDEATGCNMLKKIGSVLLVLACALFATTGVARAEQAPQPVYIVLGHPVPPAAQHLSPDAIRRAIMVAAAQRQWLVEPAGPGELIATQDARGFMAKVKVTYSQKAYSIEPIDTNLMRGGNEVHPTYNRWVRNLERDIEVRLAVEGVQSN